VLDVVVIVVAVLLVEVRCGGSGGGDSVAVVMLFTVGSSFSGKFFIQSGALNIYFRIS